ncbi:hypothetical protein, partial [Mycobacteroides abscessus]|uniref:hypothetical protein n=1 Tax=Mycobacteroides abscessus TaxID=36809 RepID=UPI001C7235CF
TREEMAATVKTHPFSWIALATVPAVVVLVAAPPAQAEPSSPTDAQAVLDQLKAQDYHVIVTKSGNGDLKECTVKSVKQLSAVRDVDAARDVRNRPTTKPTIGRKTAYVTLTC